MEEAGRQMKLLEQAKLFEAPSPELRVWLQLSEPGRIHLVLRIPAPDRGRSRIEQAILRRYLTGAATGPNKWDTEQGLTATFQPYPIVKHMGQDN